jgi:elongation factor Ts
MEKVNMQQVKELRERTQAGLNDCRSALVEAGGDMEKAVEVILKRGLAKSAKRAGAVTTEGVVVARVSDDSKSGVLVEVNIQTDFAARNEDFLSFAARVTEVASKSKASPGADLGAEAYPGGSGTVEQTRQALVAKLGENITVRRWSRLSVEGSGRVHAYVHMGGKVGALVSLSTGTEEAAATPELDKFADDVAMQITAMDPRYLGAEDVPAEDKRKQSEIFDAQLAEEGKPEKVRAKIVEGKLAKWLKEVCLLEQQSVLETEKTVGKLVTELSAKLGTSVHLVDFVRYQRGEGIDSAGADFAAEVAKLAGG